MNKLIEIILYTLCLVQLVRSHGFMRNPPARNCMWRYGYKTPVNYNDNELWCGGAWKMAALGGKCGVCGDTADQANQPNADGGKYATGIITKTYRLGQTITVDVKLTTAHLGHFEFRIGEFDNKKVAGDRHGKLQGCLLKQVNGQTRFKVPDNIKPAQYQIQLKLPSGLKCRRCVLQWWYKGGNNWGCENGKCGMGYGTQEHFVNCADVSIQ